MWGRYCLTTSPPTKSLDSRGVPVPTYIEAYYPSPGCEEMIIEGRCPEGPLDFCTFYSTGHRRMRSNFAVSTPPPELLSLLAQCLVGQCPYPVLADWLEENREYLKVTEYREGESHWWEVLQFMRSIK